MAVSSKIRVIVGMSGGVDSSLAAALLMEQGYEVVGITLKLWPQNCASRAEDKCCGPQAAADARGVCQSLGIPFYLADESVAFQGQVIDYFVREYQTGRTPNPCVLCNEKIKFGALLQRARQMGGQFVATGHYARIQKSADGLRTQLLRGNDPLKDQSYFLFSLDQDQLAHTLMPLGGLTKEETRERARKLGLKTAGKKESMEICFVPDKDYGKFLTTTAGVAPRKGEVVDQQGKVLGYHEGIAFYTIGQRKGLGIASTQPLYVVNLDAEHNRVVLGEAKELERQTFLVERCNWIAIPPPVVPLTASVKIRYKHPGVPATLIPLADNRIQVSLQAPQRAITPGQASVFYDGDLVLGGGWIAAD